MTSQHSRSPFSALGRLTVLVDDPDDALAFYRDVLGLRVLHDRTVDGYRYLHLGVPGQEGTGLWLMPATGEEERRLVGRQTGGQPLLVLYTDDLGTVAARLREHGVRMWDLREGADGGSLHFADPYGNVIVAARTHG
ncbi:VOC family protein [Streptomyces verrucosisporus]|uniref:VOC family protein n=1 Tax=Streptomyces verrucosisporus TaxID=1695161 RepID=UPI0019D0974E|nr:VOC family protein [Streptomyces verrucosisporus]MBN3928624.1 VOC family protein [Streptomyces verrucosisporus]